MNTEFKGLDKTIREVDYYGADENLSFPELKSSYIENRKMWIDFDNEHLITEFIKDNAIIAIIRNKSNCFKVLRSFRGGGQWHLSCDTVMKSFNIEELINYIVDK